MPKPKVEQAAAFIRGGTETGRFAAGKPLPALRQLAVEAGVSLVTMSKALWLLREQGVLSGAKGTTLKVAGESSDTLPVLAAEPLVQRVSPWQRVRAALEKDILTGTYEPGSPLPLIKQLQARYHTSPPSLHRVLSALSNEGVIHPHRRGYAVTQPRARGAGSLVEVYVHDQYLKLVALGLNDMHDYMGPIEIHASKAGVRLGVVPLSTGENGVVVSDQGLTSSHAAAPAGDVLGCIYLLPHRGGSIRVLRQLIARKKPVSVIAQDGYDDLPPEITQNQFVRIFPVGVTERPGEILARSLVGLGHKHVAYFSPYHDSFWSSLRFEGIRRVYETAGIGYDTQVFALDEGAWKDPAAAIPDLAEAYDNLRKKLPDDLGAGGPGRIVEYARESAEFLARMRVLLSELFEKALADTSITAWIGSNDYVGLLALRYLSARRIPVPRRIAIASFDNAIFASANGITSYSFNLPAIVGAAFGHVLGASRWGKRKSFIVEVDGMVIPRRTT